MEVVAVSNRDRSGFDQLDRLVRPGRTFALLGSSGVGKSTLVNSFAGETIMLEGEIRDGDGKGRHTTTAARLLHLADGRLLLDTPGTRSLRCGNRGRVSRTRSPRSRRPRRTASSPTASTRTNRAAR